MLYQCRLIHNGVVKENFFREGDNEDEVFQGLKMFDYGAGKWEITEPEEEEDTENEDYTNYNDEEI